MRIRTGAALAALVGLSLFAAATAAARTDAGRARTAAAGSIVYVKGGALWAASPDGRVKRRIGRAGGWLNPSQDDRGRIVAQKGIYLYRLDRRGRQLNKPITTAFRSSRVLPAFNGPFWPQVSPDGRTIAYTYSFTESHYDPACDCVSTAPALNVSYTRSDRFTDNPQAAYGLARMYSKPSWIDNRTVLMTTQNLFNFAGDVLDSLAVDTLGGGPDSYRRWFSECVVCDSLATLQMYRVDDAEMTRRRDKLAAVAGDLNGPASGSRMFLYRVNGMPPTIPSGPCHVTGPNGRFSSPTWSPDGRSLAWADARGIWIGDVGSLDGPTCQITRRLVIPGGAQPDWGPAAVR